jgi:cardiolipin synthase A/B
MNRLGWLLAAFVLPLLLLAFVTRMGQAAYEAAVTPTIQPFALIINEWSQGNGGTKEWVELLVVDGPLDLRGWNLAGDEESPSSVTFANHALWAIIPTGTIIVVYNGNQPDDVLPPDDEDPSNCVLVLPHNNNLYFSGGWPSFHNTRETDNPIIRDAQENIIHDFSTDPGTASRPGSNHSVQFNGNSNSAVGDPALWSVEPALDATPGTGNGGLNSQWVDSLCQPGEPPPPPAPEADLALVKTAPATVVVTATLPYTLTIHNLGTLAATAVLLTDTLPAELVFVADDGQFPYHQPAPDQVVWEIGTVLTNTAVTLHFTTTIALTATGWLTNTAWVTTAVTETNLSNNNSSAITWIEDNRPSPVLIDAVLYDGYELNDLDEAVALRNLADYPISLGGWQLSNNSSATIPAGTILPPNRLFWLARNQDAFSRQFGFAPDLVLSGWPILGNSGGTVVLHDDEDNIIDVIVYKQGNTNHEGWSGPSVEPYRVGTLFGEEGQILYRMRDQATSLPVPDTDSAADWAQSTWDVINGRKIQYAGWELDRFFFPYVVTETAVLTLSIAPDNSFDTLVDFIAGAQQTITIESMTFEHVGIADALVAASQRGVNVTLLLDGTPPGGYTNQGRYVCQQIEIAGGACYFMASDQENRVRSRYRFLHAKFAIADGQRVLISTENLSPASHPDDDKSDGTWGRRGLLLATDAPGVVAHVQAIFDHDRHYRPIDIHRWHVDHPVFGPPPSNFVPITETGGVGYMVRYPETAVIHGTFPFELIQAPENALRDTGGLLGLVNRAGMGDTVLVQQLTERPYWGTSTSNPQDDPNPRLEAYLDAARRGASVHLLLDSYFDSAQSPNSNAATCAYIHTIAQTEQLNLDCAIANPAGLGLHNKMVLVHIDGQGYVHIGSINGTEQSNKGNRELAIQFQSNEAYDLLSHMFWRDWPFTVYLPLIFEGYVGPANHLLISEVLYDPFGPDVAEFIELVNPTGTPIDISGYGIGDAVNPDDYEDMRRFPPGTILGPQQTIVIATTATGFFDYFGFNPDFEVVATDPTVPVLPKDPHWGHPDTFIQLGNQGDEVLLLDPNNQLVDILVYGNGYYPGVTPCPLVSAPGRSLERFPYWRNTGYCSNDFREWPFPNPGSLP